MECSSLNAPCLSPNVFHVATVALRASARILLGLSLGKVLDQQPLDQFRQIAAHATGPRYQIRIQRQIDRALRGASVKLDLHAACSAPLMRMLCASWPSGQVSAASANEPIPRPSGALYRDANEISAKWEVKAGAGTRNRTADLLITNQSLYRLSYSGILKNRRVRRIPGKIQAAILPASGSHRRPRRSTYTNALDHGQRTFAGNRMQTDKPVASVAVTSYVPAGPGAAML